MPLISSCTGLPDAGICLCSHHNKARFLFGSCSVAIRALFGNYKIFLPLFREPHILVGGNRPDRTEVDILKADDIVMAGSLLVALHSDPLGAPLRVTARSACRQKKRQP